MDNLTQKTSMKKHSPSNRLTSAEISNIRLPLSDDDFHVLMTSPWPTITSNVGQKERQMINLGGIPIPLLREFNERLDEMDVSFTEKKAEQNTFIPSSGPLTWMDYLTISHSDSLAMFTPIQWDRYNDMYDSWMEMISILNPSITWPED